MDVPIPLTQPPGPSPTLRVAPPGMDAPPTPEEFEAAVSHYKQALEGVTAPVWAHGLTCLAEGRAALLAANGPVYATFRCDHEGRTPMDVDVLAALIVMQGMGCAAFGLECEDEETALEQLERLAPYAAIPLLWPAEYPCPAVLPPLGDALSDPDVIPCASGTEALFLTPDVDVGETLRCGPDLVEEILDSEDVFGALKIAIYSEDDLWSFADAQYAIRDALCLCTDVPELLESALRLYQGRAFWDGTEEMDTDFLTRMSRKYGLILL